MKCFAGWLLGACCGLLPMAAQAHWFTGLWLTADQQGQRLMDEGRYREAAQRFLDPMRAGVAWYRAGEFQRAAHAFARVNSPEALFNRGNALLLQGRYDAAIGAYQQALKQRPDWTEAAANRDLAIARQQRLAPAEDDAGGTGGQLGADELVLDDSGRVAKSQARQTVETEAGMSDLELRELWLRRVATEPADFLRARFLRQLRNRQR